VTGPTAEGGRGVPAAGSGWRRARPRGLGWWRSLYKSGGVPRSGIPGLGGGDEVAGAGAGTGAGGGEERQPRRAWEERHGHDPGARQVGGGGGSVEGRGRAADLSGVGAAVRKGVAPSCIPSAARRGGVRSWREGKAAASGSGGFEVEGGGN
jgi:hypothetical protein